MSEKIFAAGIRFDKSEAFGFVEPLDSTCCHSVCHSMIEGRSPGNQVESLTHQEVTPEGSTYGAETEQGGRTIRLAGRAVKVHIES